MHHENPAISLYRLWRELLERTDYTQYLTPTHGIKVMNTDALGNPSIGFGRIYGYGNLCADFALHADGGFRINYFDHDLKHACYQTFLGWGWIAGSRVVFFHEHHSPITKVDLWDWENPTAYFRWGSIRQGTLLRLVPDGPSWRIDVHPNSANAGLARRSLELEYDAAARRYLRWQRREQGQLGQPRRHADVVRDNEEAINNITLLLEPYSTAKQPRRLKEAPRDRLAT